MWHSRRFRYLPGDMPDDPGSTLPRDTPAHGHDPQGFAAPFAAIRHRPLPPRSSPAIKIKQSKNRDKPGSTALPEPRRTTSDARPPIGHCSRGDDATELICSPVCRFLGASANVATARSLWLSRLSSEYTPDDPGENLRQGRSALEPQPCLSSPVTAMTRVRRSERRASRPRSRRQGQRQSCQRTRQPYKSIAKYTSTFFRRRNVRERASIRQSVANSGCRLPTARRRATLTTNP